MRILSTIIKKIPWGIIGLIIIITLVLGYMIKDLDVEADITKAIPDTLPEVKYFNKINEIFPKQEFFIVGLIADNIFTREIVAKLDKITREFENLEGVGQVLSTTNLNIIVGSEDGIEVTPILDKLPETKQELEDFRLNITTNRLYKDTFLSKDEKATIILIQIVVSEAREHILKNIKEIIDDNKAEGEQYRIAGEAATLTEVKNIITDDLILLSPIVVFVILFILFLSFRNIRGVILPILTVIISVIWTLGIMSIMKVPLSIMTTVVPTILIAIGSAYGIHIINRYYHDLKSGKDKKQSITETIKHTGLAVLMAGLTTMAGFLSFLSSRIEMIREFGIFTAVGVICALIFSVTFIPALLYILPVPKRISSNINSEKGGKISPFGKILSRLGNFTYSKKFIILLITLIILIGSIAGIFNLRVESDLVQMFGKNTKIMQDNEFFNRYFNGTMTLQLIFESDEPDKMKEPEILKGMVEFQDYVKQFEIVGSSQSLADMIMEMNRVMNGDRQEFQVIPDSKKLVSQYLLLYSLTGDESELENLVNYDFSKANITLFVKSANLTALKNFEKEINHYISENLIFKDVEIHITGRISTISVLSELIVQSQLLSIIISLILVLIITAGIFRSLILGLISIIPIIITICLNFGLMGWLNLPLDIATVLIASVAIGIGIDYTIHYISHYRTERMSGVPVEEAIINTNSTTGKAIIYNASSVGFGFLVLILSSLASIGVLGAMIALTMLVTSLGSMTLIPAIFVLMEKRKFFRTSVLKQAPDAISDIN
ncbi:MAG: RND family transporter [Spirochaetales bacterium]|nr:RND family transporter [Spirochaetales bacterium]